MKTTFVNWYYPDMSRMWHENKITQSNVHINYIMEYSKIKKLNPLWIRHWSAPIYTVVYRLKFGLSPQHLPCADPESLVRGGPVETLYTTKTDGVSQASWWWPNIECWLGSFVIFKGVQTSIPEESYCFEVFRAESRPPVPATLDLHMIFHILCMQ